VQKIDFFGGLHGHFLELAVAISIDRIEFAPQGSMFNQNGACHLKDYQQGYQPITVAGHWSYNHVPTAPNDLVIRIVPTQQYLLTAVINSWTRAGDECIELDHLEIDTLDKLAQVEKSLPLQRMLIQDHGVRQHYPRSVLRNYFYSMFADAKYGIDMFNCFESAESFCNFEFGDFFSIDQFYSALNRVAHYLNLDFVPSAALAQLHAEFLKNNTGYHQQQAATAVLQQILTGQAASIHLNIAQEAWLQHKIAEIYRCYDLAELAQDNWTHNTQEIARALEQFKLRASN
jgi:hypothetical protein